jgi:hypothetical protein
MTNLISDKNEQQRGWGRETRPRRLELLLTARDMSSTVQQSLIPFKSGSISGGSTEIQREQHTGREWDAAGCGQISMRLRDRAHGARSR